MPSTGSTRWSPTPEQLMILEELYRRGIRTPTASQIHHITAHLSLHGKIEGKNVFYWFQNHKARDRQKLRRKLLRQQAHHHLLHQLETPPPPSSSAGTAAALLQLPPLYNQTQFLPQGGDQSSNQMMIGDYRWKTIDNSSERVEMEKHNNTCSRDWMMMIMHTSNLSSNKSPKTLQLFPMPTKALKDECMQSPDPLDGPISFLNSRLHL